MDAVVVHELEGALRVQCEALDPSSVPLPSVVGLFRDLDRIARLAAGAKLRLTRLLDDAGVAGAGGDRSTAEWIAKQTGSSVGAARDSLDTSKRLGAQPSTDDALAKGQLSPDQANAVSDAAAADPAAEEKLVDSAKREGLRDLKKRCAATKANAHPDDRARREAIRRGRYLRRFIDREGAGNLHLRHLPEVTAEIEALLAPFVHGRFEAARQAGAQEAREAYAADAVLDLARAARAAGARPPQRSANIEPAATGTASAGDAASAPTRGPDASGPDVPGPGDAGPVVPKGASRAETKVLVHVDIESLLRGHTMSGSRCEIAGVGPVSVDWVREVFGEAFVAVVFSDTVDVRSVLHLSRQTTAQQRSALEARGYQCEVPGCGVEYGLEIDHIDGWALTRRTRLDDLAWLCGHHHDQKTYHGYRLTGTPGHRTWTAPNGATVEDPPPGSRSNTTSAPGDGAAPPAGASPPAARPPPGTPSLFGDPTAA